MNFDYQKYYLEQIKKHQKSILIWARQSGKSSLIVDYIIDYTCSNYNKKIFVFTPHKASSKIIQDKLSKNLGCNSNISYLNSCSIRFKWENLSDTFFDDFDVVIFDDFEFYDENFLLEMINRKYDSKFIFTTSQFDISKITYIDSSGEFYLGIVSLSSVSTPGEFAARVKYYGHRSGFNHEHEYGNIEQLYKELDIKKDMNLVDVWGIKAQRRKKLEEIAKKIKKDI